jgi:hypothetical protein
MAISDCRNHITGRAAGEAEIEWCLLRYFLSPGRAPWVPFRYGPATRSSRLAGLCQWASEIRFPSSLPFKLQGFWLLPWRGSFPAERVSLRWTHNLAGHAHPTLICLSESEASDDFSGQRIDPDLTRRRAYLKF